MDRNEEIEIKRMFDALVRGQEETARKMSQLIVSNLLLQRSTNQLRYEVKVLANDQTALDAGIQQIQQDDAAILQQINTTGTAVSTSLQDLLAKIASNPTAPVSDFTAEINQLAQVHSDFAGALTSLQTTATLATGDDPGAAAPAPAGDGAGTDAPQAVS